MNNIVVIGRVKSPLVQKISTKLLAPVNGFNIDWFADTEPLITLEKKIPLENKTALVVFQFDLSRNSINDQIAGFLFLIDIIKHEGAISITAVVPYLPYARQEKAIWAAIFKTAGIDRIITCDIHSDKSAAYFGCMLHNISTTSFWAEHIKEIIPTNNSICLVSPDNGGIERVVKIAQELNCAHTFIDKMRLSKDNPISLGLHESVHESIAIIVDDIIDTGQTAANACQLLHTHGIRRVIGCLTHSIFSPGCCQRLATAGFEKILITDTLTSATKHIGAPIRVCSISDYLAEKIGDIPWTQFSQSHP